VKTRFQNLLSKFNLYRYAAGKQYISERYTHTIEFVCDVCDKKGKQPALQVDLEAEAAAAEAAAEREDEGEDGEDEHDDGLQCLVCKRVDRETREDGGEGGEESFLLCDGCAQGGHFQCFGLDRVPDGPWYCHTLCGVSGIVLKNRRDAPVVWAKVPGHPFWPGLKVNLEVDSMPPETLKIQKVWAVHVELYA
jgi:hypothetical protein